MTSLARRQETQLENEEITDDLLEMVPLEGESVLETGEPANPFTQFQAKKPSPRDPTPLVPGGPPADITGVLAAVRQQMQDAFNDHLNHIESSFGTILKDMEGKLAFAQAELEAARRENERVKVEHQRKAEALRELKKTLEKL